MSAPTLHTASILSAPKAQLEIGARKTPRISSDEVLIKVTASAINPIDWKLRDEFGSILNYPTVLGSNAAGVIVSVGDGITDFAVGDRVLFQGIINDSDASTFQQYCKMPAALVAKTPGNISDDQAAGVCLATMAAFTALYSESGHGIQPPWSQGGEQFGRGKAIVILGGSSSVGQYAIQLAKMSGFEAIITNSSPAHFDTLLALGATTVLDRSAATTTEYAKAVGSLDVSLVLDAISIEATNTEAEQGQDCTWWTFFFGNRVGYEQEGSERHQDCDTVLEIKMKIFMPYQMPNHL
ncbi:hypothetical protein AK830_g5445 [Neonectria ditissima]|uniref:Enoyl reductase (ER) domain-containing protein n=1 Tax=Neonectria ditissima TaxID=78410 RepID=A0A0P7BL69_9HYPO|nr:hypothetical protein AK830_g5445 [Neonectria ditissima]